MRDKENGQSTKKVSKSEQANGARYLYANERVRAKYIGMGDRGFFSYTTKSGKAIIAPVVGSIETYDRVENVEELVEG